MTSWIDEAIKEEQRQDLLRDAARRRLIAQAYATKQPRRVYSPVLVQLGRWLEIRGRSLQNRYGALAEAGVIRTAGDGTSRY